MKKVIIAIAIIFGGLPFCAINSSCYRCTADDGRTTEKSLNRQLYEAVLSNDADRVSYLLENGADPNSLVDGFSPLAVICSGRQDENAVKIVQLLLDAGADPNYPCKGLEYTDAPYSTTPLMALSGWSGEILKSAKLLIDHGADVNLANELGATPAYVALVQYTNLDLAHYLIIDHNATVPETVKNPLDLQEGGRIDTLKPTLRTIGTLLNQFYPLDSREYKKKMAIINRLEKQGFDYWRCKNSDSIKRYVDSVTLDIVKARLNPRDWDQYLKDY